MVYDLTEIDTTGRLINHFNKDAPPLRYTTFDNISLRSFFYAHNSRSQSLIEKRLQQIGDAHEVTDDLALIEPMILTTKCLVAQLRQFHQAMSEFDRKIKELPQFFRRDLRRRRHKRIEMEKTKASIQKQRPKGRKGLPLRCRKPSTPRLTAERRPNSVAKLEITKQSTESLIKGPKYHEQNLVYFGCR